MPQGNAQPAICEDDLPKPEAVPLKGFSTTSGFSLEISAKR